MPEITDRGLSKAIRDPTPSSQPAGPTIQNQINNVLGFPFIISRRA